MADGVILGMGIERKKRGITQTALAKEIGIAQATLSRMERGEWSVTLVNRIKIAKALGFPEDRADELFEAEAFDRVKRQVISANAQIAESLRAIARALETGDMVDQFTVTISCTGR